MTDKEKLKIATIALRGWAKDSKMALNGSWSIHGMELFPEDREAFEASLEVAEKALREINTK